LDINIFFGIVTVVSFLSAIAFGIYQYKQAQDSNKKLEEASSNIKDLEEGLLLSDYKLRKAVDYYNEGHYKNSLEVFQKYSKESEDLSEFKETIKKIFWKETRKIYSKYLGDVIFINAIIIIAVTKADDIDTQYPEFLTSLFDLYSSKSGDEMSGLYITVFINQGKYDKALEKIEHFRSINSKKANASFREFLSNYCHSQQREA
jgi:tetratricopeptide (TPR) repeat protein